MNSLYLSNDMKLKMKQMLKAERELLKQENVNNECDCDCGKTYKAKNYKAHCKTKYHISNCLKTE